MRFARKDKLVDTVNFIELDCGTVFRDPKDDGIILMKTDEYSAIEIGGDSDDLSVGYITERMDGLNVTPARFELKEIV